MGIDAYKSGMRYEIFICRAYKSSNNSKNGAHLSYMRNLIDAENGESFVSHLSSATKQLVEVKKYISKAIDKYLKNKLTDGEKDALINLKDKTGMATDSSDLLEIIEEGLQLTNRFK